MRTIASLLLALAGLLMILIPRVIFPTCGFSPAVDPAHGGRMACNVTGFMAQGAGVATLLASGFLFFSAGRTVRGAASLVVAGGAALFVFFLFTAWPGVCKSATMPCRVGTRPAALLIAGGQLVAVAVGYVGIRHKGERGVR